MNADKFTEQQLVDFAKYERIRQGGRFNMFDPRARMAAGLTGERYLFVMENYGALKDASNEPEAK